MKFHEKQLINYESVIYFFSEEGIYWFWIKDKQTWANTLITLHDTGFKIGFRQNMNKKQETANDVQTWNW